MNWKMRSLLIQCLVPPGLAPMWGESRQSLSNSAWCRSQPPERSLLLPWQRLPATALLHWMNKAVSKEEKMAVYVSQAAATVRQITTLARSGALCKTHLRLSPSAARVTFFFFFFLKTRASHRWASSFSESRKKTDVFAFFSWGKHSDAVSYSP